MFWADCAGSNEVLPTKRKRQAPARYDDYVSEPAIEQPPRKMRKPNQATRYQEDEAGLFHILCQAADVVESVNAVLAEERLNDEELAEEDAPTQALTGVFCLPHS